jgi:hypothetical protein
MVSAKVQLSRQPSHGASPATPRALAPVHTLEAFEFEIWRNGRHHCAAAINATVGHRIAVLFPARLSDMPDANMSRLPRLIAVRHRNDPH